MKNIKLVIFDVDGVFTNGSLYLGEKSIEIKAFQTHDGLGIKMLQQSGVKVAIITARQSQLVKQRMKALGIKYIFQGAKNKFSVYQDLQKELSLQPENIAMVGDDLPDLKIIHNCGLGIAVANATDLVKQHAKYITKKTGGKGAVREVCEMIMQSQGTLEKIQNAFLL